MPVNGVLRWLERRVKLIMYFEDLRGCVEKENGLRGRNDFHAPNGNMQDPAAEAPGVSSAYRHLKDGDITSLRYLLKV